jgi:GNAT superfamily N-acetyltransferase
MVGVTLRLVRDPELSDRMRAEIRALWIDVTNAGGAVGFAGRVGPAEVRPVADSALAEVADGPDRLLVGYAGDRLAAMLFLVDRRFALATHWRTVKRVMVHPDLQGHGYGAVLMRGAELMARDAGLAALHLTVRAGAGVERFYAGLGYKEVGRLPGAIRVAPEDDRDEIHMWLPLT